jgi:hypothetical protein
MKSLHENNTGEEKLTVAVNFKSISLAVFTFCSVCKVVEQCFKGFYAYYHL